MVPARRFGWTPVARPIHCLMLEVFFLLGFFLHNLEEGLWLPAWSRHAGRFHASVGPDAFRFALIVVTAVGILVSAVHAFASMHPMVGAETISYIYHGFVGMIVANVLFPHAVATVVLRRYAPGLFTGVALNLPMGALILYRGIEGGLSPAWILAATAGVAAVTLGLITLSFRFAGRLVQEYGREAETAADDLP